MYRTTYGHDHYEVIEKSEGQKWYSVHKENCKYNFINENSVEILQSTYFPYLLLHNCPAVGGGAASTARLGGGGGETE